MFSKLLFKAFYLLSLMAKPENVLTNDLWLIIELSTF
jgi:hypothetical protein